MADETTQLILGDAAVDALNGPPRRRWFRRKRAPKETPLTHCENCGAPLTGPYCSACGQHAIDYRRSLWRVAVDAADSIFNWDTKFLKSLGILLFKPWRLTNDFNAGRRARYVHPLRLYLLASIAFFLVVKLGSINTGDPASLKAKDRAELDATLAKLAGPDSIFNDAQRAKIEAARARLAERGALNPNERAEVESTLEETQPSSPAPKNVRKQRHRLSDALAHIPEASPAPPELTPGNPAFIGPALENTPANLALSQEKKREPLHFTFNKETDEQKTPFERWIETRIKDKVGEDGTKAKLFLETLRSNIPTMMLCCVPLFAFVLKLLYLRQRRYYVEHLVYALHIHTFAYVGVVVVTLLSMAIARWSTTAQVLFATFTSFGLVGQVIFSIRRVYGQGWFFTLAKFLLGGLIYFVILILGVGITAFATLLLPN